MRPSPRPPTTPIRSARRDARPLALFQPRAELARLQPPRARGGVQRGPSAAGAAALPLDLGQQSRRILHGPRRRAQGPAARGRSRSAPTTASTPASSSPRSPTRANALTAAQQEVWATLRDRAARRRLRGARQRGDIGRGRTLAGEPFPRADLPGADAAGDRSGAPLPVHPEQGLLADLRSEAHLRRRADPGIADGAGDPAALHPPARRGGALRRDRDA